MKPPFVVSNDRTAQIGLVFQVADGGAARVYVDTGAEVEPQLWEEFTVVDHQPRPLAATLLATRRVKITSVRDQLVTYARDSALGYNPVRQKEIEMARGKKAAVAAEDSVESAAPKSRSRKAAATTKPMAKGAKAGEAPKAEPVAAATPTPARGRVDERSFTVAEPDKAHRGATAEFVAEALKLSKRKGSFTRAALLEAMVANGADPAAARIKIADCVYFKVFAPVAE